MPPQVEFLPEYQQLLPNALSLYMRLPPSHINKSQSDFIVELEVGITYSDNVAVSTAQCAVRLYRCIRALSMVHPRLFRPVFCRQHWFTPKLPAMALGCQSVAQVAGAGSEFLATSVRAQTALQVGRFVSDSQATRHGDT